MISKLSKVVFGTVTLLAAHPGIAEAGEPSPRDWLKYSQAGSAGRPRELTIKNPPAPNIGQKFPNESRPEDFLNPSESEPEPKLEPGPEPTSVPGSQGELKADKKESEPPQNNRMNALQGSKSSWSGQLNLTYSGSSISHPFSEEAPNPGNQVPPPLVTLSGTVSARYRLSDKTTMGLGTGMTTQTPFQGPKNTAIADPYLDIAHSYVLGPLRNRSDFQVTLWTNNQYYHVYGYRFGVSLSNESYYVSPFGLTAGLAFQLDYNFFDGAQGYDSSQQTEYDFYINPYFEFKLSSTVNLRSVIGIPSLHNRNMDGGLAFYHPDIYETFGVGIAPSKTIFLYPFIQFFPLSGNVTTNTVLLGFNTIINLF